MIEYGALTDLVNKKDTLDINDVLYFIISKNDTKQFILDLNRIEQLFKQGVGLDGDILGVYSPLTEFLSRGESFSFKGNTKQKRTGEPYLMLDTGTMYDSFTIQVNQDSFTIDAVTIKEGEDLEDRLGEFVGLTDESIDILVNYLIEPIVEWLQNTLTT